MSLPYYSDGSTLDLVDLEVELVMGRAGLLRALSDRVSQADYQTSVGVR